MSSENTMDMSSENCQKFDEDIKKVMKIATENQSEVKKLRAKKDIMLIEKEQDKKEIDELKKKLKDQATVFSDHSKTVQEWLAQRLIKSEGGERENNEVHRKKS